ncbi:hypothetical protein KW799_00905 [Candidatus Parcubacteria bacterium]|nr:hypothetical protein [Candidatus Parcubacteria bacterium]
MEEKMEEITLQRKLDVLYDAIDDSFKAGDFKSVDNLLKGIDVKKESVTMLLAYLTATLPAKWKLEHRKGFFERVRQEISSRPDSNKDILSGLE